MFIKIPFVFDLCFEVDARLPTFKSVVKNGDEKKLKTSGENTSSSPVKPVSH